MKSHITISWLLILILLLSGKNPAEAQQTIPVFGQQELIGGFEKETEGEILSYYSSMPVFAKDALLTRCTDGTKTTTWKTVRVPVKLDREYIFP